MSDKSFNIGGSTFGFSGVGVDELGASEYTVVGIAVDVSPSVAHFRAEIEACLKQTVESCRSSKRADNLLLRTIMFDGRVREQHGFKELHTCNPSDYDGSVRISGHSTALFDAAFSLIGSVDEYARQELIPEDYDANGIVFVITDGEDNVSSMSAHAVGTRADEARGKMGGRAAEEGLESLITILIGVNIQDTYVSAALKKFETDGSFDHYIEMDKADAKSLAKLADFISQSISSQSSALGTGGPSKTIDPSSLAI